MIFILFVIGQFVMKDGGYKKKGNLAEDKFDQASVDKALEELPKIA